MKTFSVTFYKRLILVMLALLILIPTVCAVVFGVQNSVLRRQLAETSGVHGTLREPVSAVADAIEYQELYPDLYGTADIPEERMYKENTVYLTFNSMPGDNTEEILNVLDDYHVKATFFISGTEDTLSVEQLKAIVNRGHSIGLNGYSDSYQKMYSSISAFLQDFKSIYDLVYKITGVRAEIFRYPGGSINAYNSGYYQELNAEMLRRGFVFFDWDATGEDTRLEGSDASGIAERVVSSMEGKDRSIVLLRDTVGKEAVPKALPDIIEKLQEQNFQFDVLSADIMPVVFSYNGAP